MRSRNGGKIRLVGPLGTLIFGVGVILGMMLSGVAVWGDLEAAMFDASIRGEARLRTLRCPVLMTRAESGLVSAAFKNPTERPVVLAVRTHISQGFVSLMREIRSQVSLEPGETKRLEWPVTADDAAYGRLILVRVHLHGTYALPSRDGSCGILVLDLPYLTGGQFTVLGLAASVLGMVAGIGLWRTGSRTGSGPGWEVMRAMGAVAAGVLGGMIAGLLGWWIAGVLFLVGNVLLIGAIIGHLANRRPAG